MIGFAVRTLSIVLISTALGGAVAAWRGLPWTVNVDEVQKIQGIKVATGQKKEELRRTVGVTFDEFRALVEQGAVVIDARHADEFAKGHLRTGGTPPVLNIDAGNVSRNIERLETLRGLPWVIYCTSNECDLAEELYVALEQMKMIDAGMVKIYFPGWEDFQKRKMPVATGRDEWKESGSGDIAPEQSQYQLMLETSEPVYRAPESAPAGEPEKKPE